MNRRGFNLVSAIFLIVGVSMSANAQKRAIWKKILGYQNDPIGFMTNILDVKQEHVWSKMREVCESVMENQLTAVPAGHSVSKTYTAGRLVVWFKTCFQPSTVITTAPSDNQVRNQLWREVHVGYASSRIPLKGSLTTLMWDFKPSQEVLDRLDPKDRGDWEKNFAIGFSTSPDSATEHVTKMQGWHNKFMLVILDEAGGIIPQVWKTVLDSLIINKRCKVLAVGNPTDPYSDFAEVCKPGSGWNVIPISVRDTPNYIEDREVVPNLAGREFESGIIKRYGEFSNEHLCRCLGQFPLYSEGTFYGSRIAEMEKSGHIGDYPHDETAPVYTFGDYGTMNNAILFVQFIRDTIRIIDYYYDDEGAGVPNMCRMFDRKPYNYAYKFAHWGGPDMDPQHGSNKKSLATGSTIISSFGKHGYLMHTCMKHGFSDGIEEGRSIFPQVRVDNRAVDFIDALKRYKKKKNMQLSTNDKPAYFDDPVKSPARHPADAYRHLAWIYRNQLVIGHIRIGLPKPLVHSMRKSDPYKGWNVLSGLRR